MSNVIEVANLSKQYRLGTVGTGTLSHDLNRLWAKLRGQEDPYLKIGERNDRTQRGGSDYVWALKDINFEVKQGEVLGILGRNGAGKSTLLKILSQITRPTTGSIKMKGRVAALLEVGTGFHPDLTGRDNIYINGAILGMRKWEIDKKIDAIIDFAGVEKYIDTPVKRYSSGMKVRLGFAVAAHLEPEILIVDEVLAVGDSEFQKKCIGSMKDRTAEGRTVLFVSHNLASLRAICSRGINLENGEIIFQGQIDECISRYKFGNIGEGSSIADLSQTPRNKSLGIGLKFTYFELLNNSKAEVRYGEPLKIRLKIERKDLEVVYRGCSIVVGVESLDGERIFTVCTAQENIDLDFGISENERTIELQINSPILSPGEYNFIFSLREGYKGLDQVRWDGKFIVKDEPYDIKVQYHGLWGPVRGEAQWSLL